MSKKTSRPLKFAPLQCVDAELVTDPAEIAAMEEMRKRLRRKRAVSKKALRPPKFAPLQCVDAEPVTDPAEIAAMEEMRKRLKRKQKAQRTTKNRKSTRATSSSAMKKRSIIQGKNQEK